MFDEEDGDDFPWLQDTGRLMRMSGKGYILEVGRLIKETFVIIVQKGDDRCLSLLVSQLRSSLYYLPEEL